MGIGTAFDELQQKLESLYEQAEAANIADWVIESLTGKQRRVWRADRDAVLDQQQQERLQQYTVALLLHRPVQYVLGESYFYDLKLYVDEQVLIPRPETEELADWILKYQQSLKAAAPVVLDIGTGSGCLALVVKKHFPGAVVYAADLSGGALSVARRNAEMLGLDLHLLQTDILQPSAWNQLPAPDLLISNPPYITLPEQESILPHVLDYEPHQALFVTNEDPLQFYKAIAAFAGARLRPGGSVFLEVHRDFALDTQRYYEQKGWSTTLRKDMQGAYRMLHCRRL